jgi:hypothetical protein
MRTRRRSTASTLPPGFHSIIQIPFAILLLASNAKVGGYGAYESVDYTPSPTSNRNEHGLRPREPRTRPARDQTQIATPKVCKRRGGGAQTKRVGRKHRIGNG